MCTKQLDKTMWKRRKTPVVEQDQILPAEMWCAVFDCLEIPDRLEARLVCRLWNALLRDEVIERIEELKQQKKEEAQQKKEAKKAAKKAAKQKAALSKPDGCLETIVDFLLCERLSCCSNRCCWTSFYVSCCCPCCCTAVLCALCGDLKDIACG